MVIDMISMLMKMRVGLNSFKIEMEGDAESDSALVLQICHKKLILWGDDLDETKISWAVNLSKRKYYSVSNSLRKDLTLDVQTVNEGFKIGKFKNGFEKEPISTDFNGFM